MNNLFAMVTVKNSHQYTGNAIESFFKNTALTSDDDFLLIDNDGCDLDIIINNKVTKIRNSKPLSFSENVNQAINKSLQNKKNLIFLNNDIIFTDGWFEPLKFNLKDISIPVNNQIFPYESNCGNLKLKATMNLSDFDRNHVLLNELVEFHKTKFKKNQKFQTLLMPFFCFKIPNKILNDVGYFDKSFGKGGGEDIDYRIRCAAKGYEVNFLLDSYLLHFHGKSTWDGGETIDEIEERNKIYTQAFKKRWGDDFTQIFIERKNFSSILSRKNLEELYKKRKFGDLIRKLL